jgi:hypothetical protein
MQIIYLIRLYIKLALRRFWLIPAFCKVCGRDVHDFNAPDAVWPDGATVLCYDCFCEESDTTTWNLTPHRVCPICDHTIHDDEDPNMCNDCVHYFEDNVITPLRQFRIDRQK